MYLHLIVILAFSFSTAYSASGKFNGEGVIKEGKKLLFSIAMVDKSGIFHAAIKSGEPTDINKD